MFYLTFSEYAQDSRGYPPIGMIPTEHSAIEHRYYADLVFTFENGKTVYWKNRFVGSISDDQHQYTDEERLLIVLKAVPL